VNDFEILKCLFIWKHLSEECAKHRDILLPVAEIVNKTPDGFFRADPKSLIEHTACRPYMKSAVEDEKVLSDRVGDTFAEPNSRVCREG